MPPAPPGGAPRRSEPEAGLERYGVAGVRPQAKRISETCGGGRARQYGDRGLQG
jgi:hypothetical protein